MRALLVTPTALESLKDAHGLDGEAPPVYVASRALIKEIGGYDFHQGCLGLAERPQPEKLTALLRRLDRRRPIVVLELVGNADNVGGIFRNAAAFGAAAVLLSPGCCDPLYRKAVRTSIAASLQIPFAVLDDWPGGLDGVRRQGYNLVALTPDAEATSLERYRFFESGRGAALMLGNEGDGLSPDALAAADATVRISLGADGRLAECGDDRSDRPSPHPEPQRGARTALYRKQLTRWSFTIPVACMKA